MKMKVLLECMQVMTKLEGTTTSELTEARSNALREMEQKAVALGANAIVGVDVKYEGIGQGSVTMLMVTASGTAVTIS